jgi:hypothetical protein
VQPVVDSAEEQQGHAPRPLNLGAGAVQRPDFGSDLDTYRPGRG